MELLAKFKDFRQRNSSSKSKSGRKVFAHYMVGIICDQSLGQWHHDIMMAKDAGIDGFALNVGPSDPWTNTQLRQAYLAADQAQDFVLFISFDMAAGQWPVFQVVDLINEYKSFTAQMTVDGLPLVSTFEGPGWAENWSTVRNQTGGIFLIPDWSSLGPYGVGQKLNTIDGAFSWDAWPKAGHSQVSVTEDLIYKSQLNGKKYMMGVSPYFYTNLPQWSKNWYCPSHSLWYDRWQQVLEIMPDFVQIITWNDYGESSYICDTVADQVVRGADKYVTGYSHSAFRAVLPFFIAAYKAGSSRFDFQGGDAGADGGTCWGQGGTDSAANGAKDVVSIMAATKGTISVTVAIGGRKTTFEAKSETGVSYFEMPFDCRTLGPVTITLNGITTEGPPITNECHEGQVNFNAVVIQACT
ncbi:glycoside hydrolase [Lasiosphaeria ovina]|uniref:Glycoside hydrolase n=1 Tax=Lasiosphaeria ovina TaxID=92902 RepID=A0AAE0KG80_9PEZI|nr:glycoside hydrolase [Lasiosphaeria ovina]